MDGKLSEQIGAIIGALELAQSKAASVRQAMKKQRISFGLNYDHATTTSNRFISGCGTCSGWRNDGKQQAMKSLIEQLQELMACLHTLGKAYGLAQARGRAST